MSCDFSQLKAFTDGLQRLKADDMDEFCRQCTKELAARLLAKVIKRTPVGDYESTTGQSGGTLRRGWTARSEGEAESGGRSNAKQYADSLQINKVGNTYQVEIINPVHYASYVEFGHRTRGGKGWVNGRFMLTISEQELDTQAPAILERKIAQKLMEVFGGAK